MQVPNWKNVPMTNIWHRSEAKTSQMPECLQSGMVSPFDSDRDNNRRYCDIHYV